MTVSTVNNRVPYAGNGVTTAFSFPNIFLLNADLVVLEVNNATSVETLKVLTTHYTVSGAGDPGGGTVTMLVAPAVGVTLVIYRDPALTQPIDLVNGDPLNVETGVERGFDRSTLQIQRLRELNDRALRLPEGESGVAAAYTLLPAKAARASKFLAFDSAGAPTAAVISSAVPATAFIETVLDDTTAGAVLTTLGASAFVQTVLDDTTSNAVLTTLTHTPPQPGGVEVPIITIMEQVIHAREFGVVDGNVVDCAAFLQAAIDAGSSVGGIRVILPPAPAGIRLTTGISLAKTGLTLVGQGPKSTLLTPNFATGRIITIGGTATLVENLGITGIGIAPTVTRTAGETIFFGKNTVRGFLRDCRISNAYVGVQYGDPTSLTTTVDCTLDGVHMVSTNNGIEVTGQAALFLERCRLNGVAGNSSVGINIIGPHDGLWVDSETTIEEHDTSISIAHTSGSVANIYLDSCALDRSRIAAFRINISGTAGINGVYASGVKCFDTLGIGDSDGILINSTSSGNINGLEFRDWSARDLRQRFVNAGAVVSDMLISNCVSLRGSAKSSGTYAGIDLRGLAHNRVAIEGNLINGAHSYGLIDANAATNITIIGNNFSGNVTGAMNNIGPASITRHFTGNVGVRDRRSYLIGPFTYTNLAAGLAATNLYVPTTDATTVSFIEAINSFTAIRAGRVSGMSVSSRESRTAGTATFTIYKNNIVGTLTAVLNATTPQFVASAQDAGDTFAAGDRLAVKVVTDASWAPVTSELCVWIELEET